MLLSVSPHQDMAKSAALSAGSASGKVAPIQDDMKDATPECNSETLKSNMLQAASGEVLLHRRPLKTRQLAPSNPMLAGFAFGNPTAECCCTALRHAMPR